MKRSGIIIIIITSAIALLGLIIVQALWMQEGLLNQKQQLDRSINLAVSNIAEELQNRRKAIDISNLESSPINTPFGVDSVTANLNSPLSFTVYDSIDPNGKQHRKIKLNDTIFDLTEMENFDLPEGELDEVALEDFLKTARDLGIINSPGPGNTPGNITMAAFEVIASEQLSPLGIDEFGFRFSNPDRGLTYFESDNFEGTEGQLYSHHIFPDAFMNYQGFIELKVKRPASLLFNKLWPTLLASALFLLIILTGFILTIRIIFKQKKLSDLKTDFINNMTHELKTPVATIGLITEMLSDQNAQAKPEKVRDYSKLIAEENDRLSSHIEKVLQAARLERGDFNLERELVDLHEILDQVGEKVSMRIEREQGELHTLKEAKATEILGDPVHILNVIYNLVDNAIKYKKDVPKINIRTWNGQGGLFVSVQDKGVGMNKNAVSRIFEQFYRVPTGNVHDVKGFGLGLNYVKSMMDLHGGKVTVDSTPGVGSTFTLYFPQQKAA